MTDYGRPLSWLDERLLAILAPLAEVPLTDAVYVVDDTSGKRIDCFQATIGAHQVSVRATGLPTIDANKREAWMWLALRANAHRLLPYIAQAISEGREDWLLVDRKDFDKLTTEVSVLRKCIDDALRKS